MVLQFDHKSAKYLKLSSVLEAVRRGDILSPEFGAALLISILWDSRASLGWLDAFRCMNPTFGRFARLETATCALILAERLSEDESTLAIDSRNLTTAGRVLREKGIE